MGHRTSTALSISRTASVLVCGTWITGGCGDAAGCRLLDAGSANESQQAILTTLSDGTSAACHPTRQTCWYYCIDFLPFCMKYSSKLTFMINKHLKHYNNIQQPENQRRLQYKWRLADNYIKCSKNFLLLSPGQLNLRSLCNTHNQALQIRSIIQLSSHMWRVTVSNHRFVNRISNVQNKHVNKIERANCWTTVENTYVIWLAHVRLAIHHHRISSRPIHCRCHPRRQPKKLKVVV